MADNMRGQENSANERSGHNNMKETAARRRMPGVDFESMNYEQRRAPYGNNSRSNGDSEDAGNRSGAANRRENP